MSVQLDDARPARAKSVARAQTNHRPTSNRQSARLTIFGRGAFTLLVDGRPVSARARLNLLCCIWDRALGAGFPREVETAGWRVGLGGGQTKGEPSEMARTRRANNESAACLRDVHRPLCAGSALLLFGEQASCLFVCLLRTSAPLSRYATNPRRVVVSFAWQRSFVWLRKRVDRAAWRSPPLFRGLQCFLITPQPSVTTRVARIRSSSSGLAHPHNDSDRARPNKPSGDPCFRVVAPFVVCSSRRVRSERPRSIANAHARSNSSRQDRTIGLAEHSPNLRAWSKRSMSTSCVQYNDPRASY